MTFLDLLKAKWTVYDLDALNFAWLAAIGLAYGFYQLAKLPWLVAGECRIHKGAPES